MLLGRPSLRPEPLHRVAELLQFVHGSEQRLGEMDLLHHVRVVRVPRDEVEVAVLFGEGEDVARTSRRREQLPLVGSCRAGDRTHVVGVAASAHAEGWIAKSSTFRFGYFCRFSWTVRSGSQHFTHPLTYSA